jgi:hypothetical protein
MTCHNCNTATANLSCITCMAKWILRLEKSQRLRSIELNGKHDIDALKAEIIRLNEGK